MVPLRALLLACAVGCGGTGIPSPRRPTELQRDHSYGYAVFEERAAAALGVSAADTFPEVPADSLPPAARAAAERFARSWDVDPRCNRYAAAAELYVALAQTDCEPGAVLSDGRSVAAWTADGAPRGELRGGRTSHMYFTPATRDALGRPGPR